MNGNARIESDALFALADWQAVFIDTVCAEARQIATNSGSPDRITKSHYQQVAVIAVGKLASKVEQAATHDKQKAA
jgi:hypothetical protein